MAATAGKVALVNNTTACLDRSIRLVNRRSWTSLDMDRLQLLTKVQMLHLPPVGMSTRFNARI